MLTPPGDVLPGPHHLTPPCKHYPRCGGCQLQHLDDIAYARYLVERIEGALAAQGLESDIRPPLLSPDRSRRRAVFHAERRGRQVWIGFTEARRSEERRGGKECVCKCRSRRSTFTYTKYAFTINIISS